MCYRNNTTNICQVATDCGEFSESIRAYGRLLDLKEKISDSAVSYFTVIK